MRYNWYKEDETIQKSESVSHPSQWSEISTFTHTAFGQRCRKFALDQCVQDIFISSVGRNWFVVLKIFCGCEKLYKIGLNGLIKLCTET